ncbi:SAM pointed domain-containing Ets transcription factor-like [Asterias amurensis]|uniref:SAM pointed domain-containing Ets transcription factor-like n=1 Tax=Asterias amurensis TaxID=7602 RepID=UPI003AB18411
MYTMAETCTINPTPFSGFGQEVKAFDLNLSGDFINFDFITQAQIDGFFDTAPTDTQGGLLQPVESMEGSFNEMLPTQSPIKIEELGSVNVAPLHHQSQYDADMDQVQQLIVREVMGDIVTACELINIPTDPCRWNSEQVKKWVEWTRHQYRLPEIEVGFFSMDGLSLCNLTDEQFRQLSPKSGDILYAHLDIWKNAAGRINVADDIFSPHLPAPQVFVGNEQCSYMDLSSLGGYETSSSMSNSDDEASIPSPGPTSGPNTFMTPNHTGGIHLWQFLKDLLVQPDSYGYCIRWLDRPQGIFKIEDSVEVARLWGLRKNRPAMNYDKLSRSIRQYYKKGIMKKTEIAQRLVYQFVHPC